MAATKLDRPVQDTAGPAVNPMVKLMNLVGILIIPFAIQVAMHFHSRAAVTVLCLILHVIPVVFSQREAVIGS